MAQEGDDVKDIYASEEAWAEAAGPNLVKRDGFHYVKTDPSLPRVLLYGDSISIGYTQYVQDILKGKVIVQRIPCNGGDTASGFAKLAQAGLQRGKWDVIHFNWGLHDLKYMRNDDGKQVLDVENGQQVCPVDEYVENMKKLVALMKASGAKLIWATTTPVPEGSGGRKVGDAKLYNEAVLPLMKQEGVPVNDLYALVYPKLSEYQRPANVHFLPEGSEPMAKQVAQKILAALK
jgi:acyl-CoA thioesterase-1